MAYAEMTARGQWMWLARTFSIMLMATLALALAASTALAAFGVLPWLEVQAQFGAAQIDNAGMWLQIGATVLAVSLCFFIPTDRRVMALENSHRDFRISMQDVREAFVAAHEGDRKGAFRLASEFDSVRERIVFLRDHPDLRAMEPAVLEVAAQMSELSRGLADTYSDEKVTRARSFLRQRQAEITDFDEKMAEVYNVLEELKRWNQQLSVEEKLRERQIDHFEKELFDLLPELGFEVATERLSPEVIEEEIAARKPNVIALAHRTSGQGAR